MMLEMPVFRITILLLSVTASAVQTAFGAARTITSLHELFVARQDSSQFGRTFEVTGDVVSYYRITGTDRLVIQLGNGCETIHFYELGRPDRPSTNRTCVTLNDRVTVSGRIWNTRERPEPVYDSLRLIRHQPLTEKNLVEPVDLMNGENLDRAICARGNVRNAFRDESDANFLYLDVNCNGETVNAMVVNNENPAYDPTVLIGAEVQINGYCPKNHVSLRQHVWRMLIVSGLENVLILKQGTVPNGELPDLDLLEKLPPSRFLALGLHQAVGEVLAVWHGDTALLQTPSNKIVKASFRSGGVPVCGSTVCARGLPETDYYFLNLAQATWSLTKSTDSIRRQPIDTTPNKLTLKAGRRQIDIRAHGKLVRISGLVRFLPQVYNQDARILAEADGYLFPIDASNFHDALGNLEIGCRISVTGICVIDIVNHGLGGSTPQAKGFFLVPRTPEDVVVLSRPSWWTPLRLLCVIAALLFGMAGIIVWNVALKRLAERRGRELADEQVKSVTSELKVYERTHLAVELHDSLSQTLSGVSMQVDAAKRFETTDPSQMNRHLDIAAKTLKSCRDELRNCLLDLRSNALEESDMNEAIRLTLEPYMDDADITIRFFIPREIFSDNTAHVVLRIVRELVVNAIRHGLADRIRVAGSIEGRTLKFSVRDNGRGFDVDRAPGIDEGHFGLQGIRERVEELEGEFTITSNPGSSTRAAVTIRLPNPEGNGNDENTDADRG